MVRGLLITGTSGAGKTTLAASLQATYEECRQVKAVTTRQPRKDDLPESYAYLSDVAFDDLERAGELLIRAEYRGRRYGISFEHVRLVERAGSVPLVVVTPESAARYLAAHSRGERFEAVFIDAPDVILDARLRARQYDIDLGLVRTQRAIDREHSAACDHSITNIDLEQSHSVIYSIWQKLRAPL